MGSIFILANKKHELRSQRWSCYTSSCGLRCIWLVVVWFRHLLSPHFKSYVWLQQDKGAKSLQELKILPEPWDTLKAQRFPSDTQEKIGPQAWCDVLLLILAVAVIQQAATSWWCCLRACQPMPSVGSLPHPDWLERRLQVTLLCSFPSAPTLLLLMLFVPEDEARIDFNPLRLWYAFEWFVWPQ